MGSCRRHARRPGALWLAFVVQLATVAALLAVRDVRRVRADPGAVERVPA